MIQLMRKIDVMWPMWLALKAGILSAESLAF